MALSDLIKTTEELRKVNRRLDRRLRRDEDDDVLFVQQQQQGAQ